jgi:hypothetical protein
MALKTINFYRCVLMTTRAEMVFAFNAWEIPVCGFGDVAIHAFDKAVFTVTNALSHGLIALMQNMLHVLFAHKFRIINTLRTRFGFWEIGRREKSFRARHAPQTPAHCKDQKAFHSPNPI